MGRRFLVGLLLLTPAVLTACDSFENSRHVVGPRPQSQAEAATIHLAHLSSKLLTKDVVDALSPNFVLNGDEALKGIAPVTGVFDEFLSTQVDAKVTIELTPKGTLPAPKDDEANDNNDPPDTSLSPKSLTAGVDPFTAYSTANALHQEVAVLNNYVRNFPARTGYRPYLVRLQLSVIPKRRNLPYDIYSDLIFFANLGPLNESYQQRRARATDPALMQQRKAVLAVPLLASENFERGLDSRTNALRTQLGASGAGLLGTTSVGAGLNVDRLKRLQSLVNELNGLFTIGRVTDNILRARFGAVQNTALSYEMIPRTHNISLLLLIPIGANTVEIEAKQSMRDVETGEPLARNPGSDVFIKGISEAVKPFKMKYDFSNGKNPKRGSNEDLCVFRHGLKSKPGGKDFEARKVVQFVRKRLRGDLARGDFDTFKKRVKTCLQRRKVNGYEDLIEFEAVDRAHVLWTQIAQIQADLPDAFVSFEVPKDPEDPKLEPADHRANWTVPKPPAPKKTETQKPTPAKQAPKKPKAAN